VSAIAQIQLGHIAVVEDGGSSGDEFVNEPREKLAQDLGAAPQ